jgi:hypothetical protein
LINQTYDDRPHRPHHIHTSTLRIQEKHWNIFLMDSVIGPVDSPQVIRSSSSFHLYCRIQSHYVISRQIVILAYFNAYFDHIGSKKMYVSGVSVWHSIRCYSFISAHNVPRDAELPSTHNVPRDGG